MLDIKQEVNPGQSWVMGRNGLWNMKQLHIWQTGDSRVVFDCISAKRGIIINGGFGIDGLSFEQLVCSLIDRKTDSVGRTKNLTKTK